MHRLCRSLGAGGPWGRVVLGLLVLASLTACALPVPPAPGLPGLNLRTPLPYTPAALPPTASPSPLAVPTANTALPQVVLTNSAGTAVRLYVEIADTPAKQETGLMNRPALLEDQGMLFVFPGETTISFWMENTLIPLSIAFIAADGAIVDIQDMKALDTTLHTPAHPYVDALEVNVGYFARHGVLVGNHVALPLLPTPLPAPLTPTVLDGSP